MIKKKSINILKHKIKLPMDQMWDDDSMTSEHRRTWIKTRAESESVCVCVCVCVCERERERERERVVPLKL